MEKYNKYRKNLDTLINIKEYDSLTCGNDNLLIIDTRYFKGWRTQTNAEIIAQVIKISFINIMNLMLLPKINLSESCSNLIALSRQEYCINTISYLKKALQGIERLEKFYEYNKIKGCSHITKLHKDLRILVEKYNVAVKNSVNTEVSSDKILSNSIGKEEIETEIEEDTDVDEDADIDSYQETSEHGLTLSICKEEHDNSDDNSDDNRDDDRDDESMPNTYRYSPLYHVLNTINTNVVHTATQIYYLMSNFVYDLYSSFMNLFN